MLKEGDLVTCKRPVEAYYSSYGGNQHCVFNPGDVGIVASPSIPAVHPGKHATFARIEFFAQGGQNQVYNQGHDVDLENGTFYPPFCEVYPTCDIHPWSVALAPDNIKPLRA